MKRTTTLATLLTGLIFAAACGGPSLSVSVVEPAEFNVRNTTKLVVGESLGRPLAKELSAEVLHDLVQADNYFALSHTLSDDALNDGEALVRMDVAEFFIREDVQNQSFTDEHGQEVITQIPVLHATVLLEISLSNHEGPIVDRVLYEGEATLALNDLSEYEVVRDSEIYRAALEGALIPFLTDITPQVREHSIALDDSDEALTEAVSAANARSFAQATELFENHLEQNPDSSEAHYNLGAMLDSQSRFEEALVHYDAAIAITPKTLYRNTRSECSQRIYFRDVMR